MSYGGGYMGGKTRMGTAVTLNIYDLSPANDCLYAAGFGLHHSGVEIMGTEYTFASGSGIFEMTPKEEHGAKFRGSVELGNFEGGSSEVKDAISELRSSFGPDSYNLITRNCNHFANALVYTLLRKQIPSYVNRLANVGSYVSCLLPKKMLENAPVGGGTNNEGSSPAFHMHAPSSRGINRNTNTNTGGKTSAFSGQGMSLGASSSSSGAAYGKGIRSVIGNVAGFGSSNGSNSERKDDLIDRRERARKAALARLANDEKSQ